MSLPEVAPESIALVTGASSGIGEQFARQLAERGYRLALVARREERLAQLAEDLGGSDRALAFGADLTVPDDRDRLASRIADLGARVEILVNNGYFAEKLPKFTFVSPERVAEDALRAAARGKISVIPGGMHVRLAFGPNRKLPRWLVLPISKRLMARA